MWVQVHVLFCIFRCINETWKPFVKVTWKVTHLGSFLIRKCYSPGNLLWVDLLSRTLINRVIRGESPWTAENMVKPYIPRHLLSKSFSYSRRFNKSYNLYLPTFLDLWFISLGSWESLIYPANPPKIVIFPKYLDILAARETMTLSR